LTVESGHVTTKSAATPEASPLGPLQVLIANERDDLTPAGAFARRPSRSTV
jgi:hypothetical protein